jgi:GNAT superfamily N-acetyltransferase
VSTSARFDIIDVTEESAFGQLPPCVDPRFDHRSCNYWEDDVQGSKAARSSWWQPSPSTPQSRQRPQQSDNPFAVSRSSDEEFNPFAATAMAAAMDPFGGDDLFATPSFNPFAPETAEHTQTSSGPRKLRLLARGSAVFGSYAKVLLIDRRPSAYAQFGPLSAYPRARQIRDLYPRLPQSPLPAVITCIATVADARGQGIAAHLVEAVCDDLAGRGFAAIEAYPDLTLKLNEASAGHPAFWMTCGFDMAIDDERYPVMRRPLD